jgi:hypothetical protein
MRCPRLFLLALAAPFLMFAAPAQALTCPTVVGWSEGLARYQEPATAFPVNDTQQLPTADCSFHQWSWEAFAWATALDKNGVPRFMTLKSPEDLLKPAAAASAPRPMLRLAARSHARPGATGFTEGAGAIVQADGNIFIAQNGYPVYASVHMNECYFRTARDNLIVNGGFQKNVSSGAVKDNTLCGSQKDNKEFYVGAAIFKATWLRLAPGEAPPEGAFVTRAEVPRLQVSGNGAPYVIQPEPGKFDTVEVALVGLHVVGYTLNHPEFLWGTFEHALNTPQFADNTFDPSSTASNPNNFTFYKASTPYTQVNAASPATSLTFDPNSQRFLPANNAVLENATGGENQTDGVTDIQLLNKASQSFFAGLKGPQSAFKNYFLAGTVWMAPCPAPCKFNLNANQTDAFGSVNLANTTAETFVQVPTNKDMSKVQNCFLCHNGSSFNYVPAPGPPFYQNPMPNRLVAFSHALAIGTPYAVVNQVLGQIGKVK